MKTIVLGLILFFDVNLMGSNLPVLPKNYGEDGEFKFVIKKPRLLKNGIHINETPAVLKVIGRCSSPDFDGAQRVETKHPNEDFNFTFIDISRDGTIEKSKIQTVNRGLVEVAGPARILSDEEYKELSLAFILNSNLQDLRKTCNDFLCSEEDYENFKKLIEKKNNSST